MPNIPKLEKMCFCLDVKKGVLYWSILLVVLWLLYFISVIVTLSGIGNIIWGVVWSILGVVVYGLVVYVILKDKARNLLLPALFTSAFNVVVSIINAIVNFVVLNWLGAILLLVIAAITLYYFLGLYTVYQDTTAPPAGEPDLKLPA